MTALPTTTVHTAVIGAGPAGLAVTGLLLGQGVPVRAFDENDEIAHVWRNRYDNLRLNSVRWLSQLPGLPLPKRYGRWVSRDDFVEYLMAYAAPVRRVVRTGVRVTRVRPGGIASRWQLETTGGLVGAHHVVFATGLYHEPVMPGWRDAKRFSGRLLHAHDYRAPKAFEGANVVVVGAGVTGVDITADLLQRAEGSVGVAVRTAPGLLPRELYGVPLQGLSVTNRYAPIAVQDLGGRIIQRLSAGDLSRTPLGSPAEGMFTRLRRTGVSPSVDDGVFVPAVRSGQVRVIGEVTGFYRDGVVTGEGERVPADTVIAATGYRTGLEKVIDHPRVFEARGVPAQYGAANRRLAREGLHFVGYASPLTGHLREIGLLARRTARLISGMPR
jgi:cation diffusion facilitator CzcD-associated flavoprotein CzcO